MKSICDERNSSFVYCELMQLNQKYVDSIINSTTSNELMDIWDTMSKSAFICSEISISELNNHLEDFKELSLQEQKNILLGVLDKNMMYVNYSDIDDVDYCVSDEDKNINNSFYEEKTYE